MKVFNKIIKISFAVGIVLLIISAVTGVFKKDTWNSYNQNMRTLRGYYDIAQKVDLNIEQFDDIEIIAKSNNIRVISSGAATEAKLKYSLNYEDEYIVTSSESSLKLERNPKIMFNFWFFVPFSGMDLDNDIIIEVPKDFELQKLKLRTSSGNITIDGIKVDRLEEVRCASGNINILNSVINDFGSSGISAASGNVKIKSVEVKSDINISVTSGSITLENGKFANINTSVASGSTKMSDCEFADLKHSGMSGNITLTKCIFVRIDSDVKSGNCTFRQMDMQDTEISVSARSGNCKVNGAKHGNSYYTKSDNVNKWIASKTLSGNTVFTDCTF